MRTDQLDLDFAVKSLTEMGKSVLVGPGTTWWRGQGSRIGPASLCGSLASSASGKAHAFQTACAFECRSTRQSVRSTRLKYSISQTFIWLVCIVLHPKKRVHQLLNTPAQRHRSPLRADTAGSQRCPGGCSRKLGDHLLWCVRLVNGTCSLQS